MKSLSPELHSGLTSSVPKPIVEGRDYQSVLQQAGARCSMSRKGNCWDNAVVESFFHSLKTERIRHRHKRTRTEAYADVQDYC